MSGTISTIFHHKMFRNVTVNSVRKNHIPLLSNLLDQVCSKVTSAVFPLDYILQSYQIIKECPGCNENQNGQKINNGECFFVSWYIRNKENSS